MCEAPSLFEPTLTNRESYHRCSDVRPLVVVGRSVSCGYPTWLTARRQMEGNGIPGPVKKEMSHRDMALFLKEYKSSGIGEETW